MLLFPSKFIPTRKFETFVNNHWWTVKAWKTMRIICGHSCYNDWSGTVFVTFIFNLNLNLLENVNTMLRFLSPYKPCTSYKLHFVYKSQLFVNSITFLRMLFKEFSLILPEIFPANAICLNSPPDWEIGTVKSVEVWICRLTYKDV